MECLVAHDVDNPGSRPHSNVNDVYVRKVAMESFGSRLRAKLERLRTERNRGEYLLADDKDGSETNSESSRFRMGVGAGKGSYRPPRDRMFNVEDTVPGTLQTNVSESCTKRSFESCLFFRSSIVLTISFLSQDSYEDKAETIRMAETLGEMLSAVDPCEEGVMEGTVFEELVKSLEMKQAEIEQRILLLTGSDEEEEHLAQALDMNDAIQFVLEEYRSLKENRRNDRVLDSKQDVSKGRITNLLPSNRTKEMGHVDHGPRGTMSISPPKEYSIRNTRSGISKDADSSHGNADLLGLGDGVHEQEMQAKEDPFVGSPQYSPVQPRDKGGFT